MVSKLASRRRVYGSLSICFIACIFVVAACQSSPDNQETLPAATMDATVPVVSSTPTSSSPPPATPIPPVAAGFPLQLGATWVYSHTAYFGTATSTYIITETIVSLEAMDTYWVAEMARQWRPVAATLAETNVSGLEAPQYWYIFDLPHVYRQTTALDLDQVEGSWLEYLLPLRAEASWFPDPEQRRAGAVGFVGQRRVETAGEMTVPAGTFSNCFMLFTGYNSGPTRNWFCTGVGLVERQFDHQGTSYGFHTILTHVSASANPGQ